MSLNVSSVADFVGNPTPRKINTVGIHRNDQSAKSQAGPAFSDRREDVRGNAQRVELLRRLSVINF
jgi:hypothetical protein